MPNPNAKLDSISIQASLLTDNQNTTLIKVLFEEIESCNDVKQNVKKCFGTLYLLLKPLLDDKIKDKIQKEIRQLAKNQQLKPDRVLQGYMSPLTTDTFIHLAGFLSWEESVKMRHLNKYCNKEFVNIDLIKQRRSMNEAPFVVDQFIFNHIQFGGDSSLLYQYPIATAIDLGIEEDDNRADLFNADLANYHKPFFECNRFKEYWNAFFAHSNDISFRQGSINMLEHMSIETVFNQKHANPVNIQLDLKSDRTLCQQSFDTFKTNYQQYLSDECKNSNENIRTIKVLKFVNTNDHGVGRQVQSFIEIFKCNFLHLSLVSCVVRIESKEELYAIFHSKLETLQIYDESAIIIDDKLLPIKNDCDDNKSNDNDNSNDNNYDQNSNLHTLYLTHFIDSQCEDDPRDTLLKIMQIFKTAVLSK